jgi:hypothetical protein
VRALVLTPTRELAAQVEESVRTYGKYVKLSSAVIFGGVNINPQIQRLERGVDILVATPGRLLDLLQQGAVDLKKVEMDNIIAAIDHIEGEISQLKDTAEKLKTNMKGEIAAASEEGHKLALAASQF